MIDLFWLFFVNCTTANLESKRGQEVKCVTANLFHAEVATFHFLEEGGGVKPLNWHSLLIHGQCVLLNSSLPRRLIS